MNNASLLTCCSELQALLSGVPLDDGGVMSDIEEIALGKGHAISKSIGGKRTRKSKDVASSVKNLSEATNFHSGSEDISSGELPSATLKVKAKAKTKTKAKTKAKMMMKANS